MFYINIKMCENFKKKKEKRFQTNYMMKEQYPT
jgi:hypothetical protein